MKINAKKAVLNLLGYRCQLCLKFRENYKYIIILSHMRSGSSLLIHLLASNSDVLCYGESHLSYDNPKSLIHLVAKNFLYRRKFFPTGIFVADKILHSKFRLDVFENFPKNRLKIIYLLREPMGTISSLRKAGAKRGYDYYFERLVELQSLALRFGDRIPSLLLSYDNLIWNTKKTLETLQIFLGLENKFSEEYPILPSTGEIGIGDPSENIKKGKIIRKSTPKQIVGIKESQVIQMNKCFLSTWDTIKENSITVE